MEIQYRSGIPETVWDKKKICIQEKSNRKVTTPARNQQFPFGLT